MNTLFFSSNMLVSHVLTDVTNPTGNSANRECSQAATASNPFQPAEPSAEPEPASKCQSGELISVTPQCIYRAVVAAVRVFHAVNKISQTQADQHCTELSKRVEDLQAELKNAHRQLEKAKQKQAEAKPGEFDLLGPEARIILTLFVCTFTFSLTPSLRLHIDTN